MIYHTAADKGYFDCFFKRWHQSIKKFQPKANFSLRYIGNEDPAVLEYCTLNNIKVTFDSIRLDEIIKKYNVSSQDARGYYALSRWTTIPEDDDVCVTDIDIIQLNPLDMNFDTIFSEYPLATIARKKEKHPNMMMCFFISKNMTSIIRNRALSLINASTLSWHTDTKIMRWIEENYSIYKDFGLFKLNVIHPTNVPPHVKFGYFSSKNITNISVTDEKLKKIKYDMFFEDKE